MTQLKQNPSSSPLSILKIFDRLEVGPVRVESRRLIAPYRLFIKGRVDEISLIYTYQEKVFDPSQGDSHNLANMIAVQVAMNYGLFCDRIVFRGDYHPLDQQFISDMTENTCREIYVKKFLEPNPFLVGEAAHLPVLKQKKYTQAQLLFPDSSGKKIQSWNTDPHSCTILSSGGKDSLLSYGLLHEIGCDIHPVFINESGRHWYTALNSYRYFEKNIANTARVWSNCDRVFNWMLRHFPFIRQDFASIRSDEYPIRLWTVAVFLFGALPLMRKRRIGALIIGDEFDTTVVSDFHGIAHYNGLYDQSHYFDATLSRYFEHRGFGIRQFSILRPLSEVLIEKILAQRYPHLLQNQISCHAAHLERHRVKPCGRCEKCRRIVCMLTAMESDARRCGYTDEQIRFCLKELEEKDLHQESESVQLLLYMLHRKGVINLRQERLLQAKEHREILQVRFDPDSAPLDVIPFSLREPLCRIFDQYAQGFVQKSGTKWMPFDPFHDSRFVSDVKSISV